MESIIMILLAFACMILPFVITAFDIYYLFIPYERLPVKKRGRQEDEDDLSYQLSDSMGEKDFSGPSSAGPSNKLLLRSACRSHRRRNYMAAVFFGAFCQLCWESLFVGISEKKWYEPIITGSPEGEDYHEYISTEFGGWFWMLLLLSVIVTLVMNFMYEKRKPPLVSALFIGLTSAACVLSVIYMIQLGANIDEESTIAVLYVLPVNYFMIAARSVLDEISAVLKNFEADGSVPDRGFNGLIYRMLSKCTGKWAFVFLSLIPAAGVLAVILVLSGQGPDALTKAFTMTADWTFSTQTPPPPEIYEGHYLCTVSAGGHRRLVKPLRMGVRAGDRIIVNRQLCVANAFEDLIMDRMPCFHRALRGFYDRYGYPICHFITTPLRADITYIIMKPLEWLFIIVLYLFDTKPESRISAQYTGRKYKE